MVRYVYEKSKYCSGWTTVPGLQTPRSIASIVCVGIPSTVVARATSTGASVTLDGDFQDIHACNLRTEEKNRPCVMMLDSAGTTTFKIIHISAVF